MDPVTASLLISGISGLGKMFGMGSAKKQQKADRAESRRQFDARQALDAAANSRQQGEYDARVASRKNTDPARQAMAQKLFAKLMGGGAMPMPGGPTSGPPPMPPTPPVGGGGMPPMGGGPPPMPAPSGGGGGGMPPGFELLLQQMGGM